MSASWPKNNIVDLIEFYLAETTGTPLIFRANYKDGQRLGQAFFNSLSREDQYRIRGTVYDCFYSDRFSEVAATLDFLTK